MKFKSDKELEELAERNITCRICTKNSDWWVTGIRDLTPSFKSEVILSFLSQGFTIYSARGKVTSIYRLIDQAKWDPFCVASEGKYREYLEYCVALLQKTKAVRRFTVNPDFLEKAE